MKQYKYFFLDLDGTIIDSKIGVTKSVEYALNFFNIQVSDRNELCKFIGPPLTESFKEFYHFSEEQATLATAKYRERYAKEGVFENELYEGVRSFIEKAHEQGYFLMLATSKPLVFAKQIIDDFNLTSKFTFIGGTELVGSRKNKVDVIRYVLKSNRITNLSEVIMIGDRKYDILGANEAGIDSVGVLYGYGSLFELEAAGANFIVKDIYQLAKLFDFDV